MTGTEDTRQAALILLGKIDGKITFFKTLLNKDRDEGETENWIIDAWLIELQLFRNARESLEQQLIKNEFDF